MFYSGCPKSSPLRLHHLPGRNENCARIHPGLPPTPGTDKLCVFIPWQLCWWIARKCYYFQSAQCYSGWLFADVGCGSGVLVNVICIKIQQMDAGGISNLVDYIESAHTITFKIMDHTIYNKPAECIFGSFCNPSIMAPILDRENACILFKNYGGCMEGMPQSGLEILLEQHCRRCTHVASFSPMYLLP